MSLPSVGGCIRGWWHQVAAKLPATAARRVDGKTMAIACLERVSTAAAGRQISGMQCTLLLLTAQKGNKRHRPPPPSLGSMKLRWRLASDWGRVDGWFRMASSGRKGEALRGSTRHLAAASPSPLCRSKWDKHCRFGLRAQHVTSVVPGRWGVVTCSGMPQHKLTIHEMQCLLCSCGVKLCSQQCCAGSAGGRQTWPRQSFLEHEVISTCR
jgi:hypothetical protein